MDVTCIVDSLLLTHIERTIVDAKDKLIEAVRHRYKCPEEVGVAMKFVDKASFTRTSNELSELGVTCLDSYLQSKNYFRDLLNCHYCCNLGRRDVA